jgi:hypothetical protein
MAGWLSNLALDVRYRGRSDAGKLALGEFGDRRRNRKRRENEETFELD